jgi:hypothetical protein
MSDTPTVFAMDVFVALAAIISMMNFCASIVDGPDRFFEDDFQTLYFYTVVKLTCKKSLLQFGRFRMQG